jgi:hypothetical protein
VPISRQSGHILGNGKTTQNLDSVCRISVGEYSYKKDRNARYNKTADADVKEPSALSQR